MMKNLKLYSVINSKKRYILSIAGGFAFATILTCCIKDYNPFIVTDEEKIFIKTTYTENGEVYEEYVFLEENDYKNNSKIIIDSDEKKKDDIHIISNNIIINGNNNSYYSNASIKENSIDGDATIENYESVIQFASETNTKDIKRTISLGAAISCLNLIFTSGIISSSKSDEKKKIKK